MPAVRTTQRAPLSCASCAAKKIKCSKDIPCRPCISRGIAAECHREVVWVRGKLRTADSPRGDLTYAELLHENAKLAALIGVDADEGKPVDRTIEVNDCYEAELWDGVGQSSRPRKLRERHGIHQPSRTCSNALVAQASVWTSWIHYAFFFPHFQQQHERYWSEQDTSSSMWLALYFSVLASTLLFMDDKEYEKVQPPPLARIDLLRNWYEAALFHLDEADFLRSTDLQVVQAITILGIVATNIGDTARHSHLWAVAVRMAQTLKLGMDKEHQNETPLQRESRRRLWWTLIICEWLPIPARDPCISASDFDCELPGELDDQSLLENRQSLSHHPRPVQYHIAMSRVSVVVHRFRATIRAKAWSASQIANIVSSADDELASLIVDLPAHLQNDDTPSLTAVEEQRHPWIPFQRRSLTLVLLHHRIVINRVLQRRWLEGSLKSHGSRAMCLNSALAIIHVASSNDADFSTLRPWALAMHVFSALTTLTLEIGATDQPTGDLMECVESGIRFLDQVQSDNMVAKEGLKIIRRLSQEHDVELTGYDDS